MIEKLLFVLVNVNLRYSEEFCPSTRLLYGVKIAFWQVGTDVWKIMELVFPQVFFLSKTINGIEIMV